MGRRSRKKKEKKAKRAAEQQDDPQRERAKRARVRERRERAAREEAETRKRDMADDKRTKPSRLKLAFLNSWNLLALGAAAALTVVTKSPVPLAVGGVLEAGWLAFATRPKASRLLFSKKHEAHDSQTRLKVREVLLEGLPEQDAERVTRLDERRAEILRLCGDHRHIASEVLLAEVERLEEIVEAFIELASTSARWEAYLASVDLEDLESETRRYEEDAQRAVDPQQRELAAKNLAVLLRRREQVDELRKKVAGTRGQLDLIESTFRMIGNEIMLMRSTDQLKGQLDDLVVGVQAVREVTTAEPAGESDEVTRARAARAAAAAQAQGRR